MKNIQIDMDDLLFAYRDEEPQNIYYLNTEYGEVRLVNRGLADLKDLTDEIEISHHQFLYVPKLTREEIIEDLQTFSSSIVDPKLKQLLPLAFENQNVIGTYKAILSSYQAECSRLEEFLKAQASKRLLIWLKANFIEPTD